MSWRATFSAPLTALALASCGSPELDQLEQEQAALRDQLDDMKSEVARLNDEMVGAGLMRKPKPGAAGGGGGGGAHDGGGGGGDGGKRPGGQGLPLGNPLPDNVIDLGLRAERRGAKPRLPKLVDLKRTESECGFRFMVRPLQPISDFPLNSTGYGKASPVQMFENGEPLTPHAMPPQFEQACQGAYRHAGNVILFSPNGTPEAAESNAYTIELADAFPFERGDDGRPMYWIYPGTTATFHFDKGWNDDWGKMMITLGGKVAVKRAQVPATITTPAGVEETSTGKPPMFIVETKVDEPPRGPWSIEIASPDGGPYLLLDVLTIGNRSHAAVVTSDKAYKAGSP